MKPVSFLFAFAVLFLVAIQPLTAQDNSAIPKTTQQQIESILEKQVVAWNAGDLEKFMATYWKSDLLTFSSGGKTTRGWNATLANYKKSYAPPNEMGKLHFDHLEVIMLETNSALVLGHWHLRMKEDRKLDGNFSLVLRRLKGEWKIVHDHSSTSEKKEESEPDKAK